MSGANRNFQNMDLNFDPPSRVPDLNRAHLLYKDTEYNGNRHLQFSDQISYNQPCQEDSLKYYVGSGVTFVSLVAENLVCHPFVVLRRQCQVHYNSESFHLQPLTLIPTIYRLYQHQGLVTLWKGLGSSLLVRGIALGIEDVISKITPWPKNINWHSSLKQFLQHILLKCVSLAIVTPFYSVSFMESVQSDIASEKPGIFDIFREGAIRLLYWGAPSKARMLPIWALIIPTVALGLGKYLFSLVVKETSSAILQVKYRNRYEENGALPKDNTAMMQHVKLTSSVIATVMSDIVFYPCETVVHRLHLQGTRTIIDNLDNGRSVLPILTNYIGAVDCYNNCLGTEGVCGLYKGFGALILQYTVHITLLRMSYFLLSQIQDVFKKAPECAPVDISPPVISNVTSVRNSYLLP